MLTNHWAPSPAANSCILSASTSEIFLEPCKGWYPCPTQVWVLNSHLLILCPVLNLCIATTAERLLWSRVRTIDVCGYKCKCSRRSLTTYSFSKTIVAPHSRVCDLQSHGLLTRLTVPGIHSFLWSRLAFRLCGWLFLQLSHLSCTGVISCLASWSCGTQNSQ